MVETRYCPKCRVVRNMRESLSRRRQAGPKGKAEVIVTRTLHCAVCGTFVQSEERVEKVPLVRVQGGGPV